VILVDSSVLVLYLRGGEEAPAMSFAAIIERGLPFGIEPYIFQEVLQGARDEAELRRLDRYLSAQRIYGLLHGLESHRGAARIYFDCRRRGLTVRSMVDCLVAQTAMENDLALLARDRDYDAIAQVSPLKLW
jgi:predicted nucleic acid-binding protein